MIKKNVAVVGFGFMGMMHTANILKSKKMNLVAIVSKHPAKVLDKIESDTGNFDTADLSVSQLQNLPKYASLKDCLQYEQLDAVFICTHTDLHFELTREALAAGLHVFLEKPMVLEEAEGKLLIDLAKEQSRIFMVGHVLRFMPPYQRIRQWVEEKTYGSLKFISLNRFSGLPTWGQWKEKQQARGSSGGALFDLLIHDIDFAQYLLGIPESISVNNLPGRLSDHDYIQALWQYHDKEARVSIEGGNTFHSQFPFQAGIKAVFEKASANYSTEQPNVIRVANNETVVDIDLSEEVDGFVAEVEYFADCISGNQLPERCLPESSLETIRLCHNHINKQ
ncbi:MAG: Gfo/Idh/MocA family oxidoreductase [Cyclobacteriaceae bacterium]